MSYKFYLLIVCLVLVSCKKEESYTQNTEKVIQDLRFEVFAAKDYADTTYQAVQVSLKLEAGVLSTKTGVYSAVWDTTIHKPLNQFPSENQPFVLEKSIKVTEKEKLVQVAKSVRYTKNNLINQKARFEPVPTGLRLFVFKVGI